MSGLAAVLARRRPTGVFRWRSRLSPEEIEETTKLAGWRLAHLDGAHAQTKAEVLDAIGKALEFPDYYGANLDALDECLCDIVEPAVLLWDAWEILATADQRSFTSLVHVLSRRARLDRDSAPSFVVLLRTGGMAGPESEPDPGVPLLD